MKTKAYLRSVRVGRACSMAAMLLCAVCAWVTVFYLASGNKQSSADRPVQQFWQIASLVTTLACGSMWVVTIFRLMTGRYLLPGEETSLPPRGVSVDNVPIPVDPADPRSANLTPQQRSLQSVFNHVAKTGDIVTGTIDADGCYQIDAEADETPA